VKELERIDDIRKTADNIRKQAEKIDKLVTLGRRSSARS